MSPKSTELLNNTLNSLEQNDIHMLVWEGTRMAGFLDACKQSSAILVPFLNTLIAGKIREEDPAFILSAKGLFTLELFSDLHSIFANQYLHCVDSDCILSCKVYPVAHHNAENLIHPTMQTPKADKIFNSLHLDQNNNVLVTLEDPLGSQTTHTLNEKLTQHYNLQTIKENVFKTQNHVLNKLHDNIIDQNRRFNIQYPKKKKDQYNRRNSNEIQGIPSDIGDDSLEDKMIELLAEAHYSGNKI